MLFLSACGGAKQFSQNQASSSSINQPIPQADPGSTAAPSIPPPAQTATVLSTSTIYNFAAGEQASCERSVLAGLGHPGTCTVGGACAGTSAVLYGACLQGPRLSTVTFAGSNKFGISVTSPDRVACDAVFSSRNFNVRCSLGGGCTGDSAINASTWGGCYVN